MHPDIMILVCHAADGRFADGNRAAVRRVLDWADYIAEVHVQAAGCYAITCSDGGRARLRAPGLDGTRSFHRIDMIRESAGWTPNLLTLIFDLMQYGGFGLMETVDVSQFIVTQPLQITYYPWLPQPPLLVRSANDLGQLLA